MKNLLFIAAVVVLFSVTSFGQGSKTDNTAPKHPSATAVSNVPIREKFDPTRDPKINLQKAVETAAKSGKHIILDVGGEWCGWCVYMDKFIAQNPTLARLRDNNFVWVKVNYSEENENPEFLSAYPAATGYPHLYVLDETGKLLQSQDTSVLEKGDGYDLSKFTAFLTKWSPEKKAVAR